MKDYSLATAPLAVLGKLPEALRLTDGLAAVVRQLAERLEREAVGDQADRLLTAAYILTGLRFGEADETVRGEIKAIRDIEVLEELTVRLVTVASWAELLA